MNDSNYNNNFSYSPPSADLLDYAIKENDYSGGTHYRKYISMRELLEDPALINQPSKLTFAAGRDSTGHIVLADIEQMPHLLIAGTTGSGKTVFLNSILMTLLFRAEPSEVGLVIIDSKGIEFGLYQGIPHLMKDVATNPQQAISALRWAVSEIHSRYQRMQLSLVRNFKAYNDKVKNGKISTKEFNPRTMNQIVIIIDDLYDLVVYARDEAEALLRQLTQKASAAGIHLIISTQSSSPQVISDLIKSNIPSRVAFLTTSQKESRLIIDSVGAEKLLGNGDMLLKLTGQTTPVRIQSAFITANEIHNVVDYLIKNNQRDYFLFEDKEIETFINSLPEEDLIDHDTFHYDEHLYEAGMLCIEMGKASSSMIQRRFNIGFNRAFRIIDQLEQIGVIGAQIGARPRNILVDPITFHEMYQELMKWKNRE